MVCIRIQSLVEGVSCARYRCCRSGLPTLLSWLSLHCTCVLRVVLTSQPYQVGARYCSCEPFIPLPPDCPQIVSFLISLFFLTSTQTNLMRSSLEIQTDIPGTQGLHGFCATFSDGARVSTESLQSPPPLFPIKTNLKEKREEKRRNGARFSPG